MFTPEELMAVEPAAFAATVAATPDHELAEGMATEFRTVILDEVFRRMEEHFDPKKSKKLDLVIHFHLEGAASGSLDSYQVIIQADKCTTSKDLDKKPKLALTLDGVDFLKLATNNLKGMDLYIKGRLKVDGNLILATRLQGLFLLPDADGAASAHPTAAATQTAPPATPPAPETAAPAASTSTPTPETPAEASTTTPTSPAATTPPPQPSAPVTGTGDSGTGPDESKEQMQNV